MTYRIPRALVAAGLLVASIIAVGPAAHAAQPTTWNFTQTRVPLAQAAGHNGSGVTVAVLDTWVDPSHPEFKGRVLQGADCVGGSCKSGLAKVDGCEPHGTHVAGIITSQSYGVAPASKVLPVRVLSFKNGTCTADSRDVARAVTWAADHGARIINISLGTAVATGSVADVTAAVEDANSRGILVVAAAGNEAAPVGNAYGKDALVVAATAPNGQLASYSQRGNGVDLAAPGGDPVGDDCQTTTCIVSTWSEHRIAAFAGTSMAAPHVAGIAALLWGQNPSRPLSDVVNRLLSTAHGLNDAGHGVVDAARALNVSTGSTKPTSTPTATPTQGTSTPAGSGGGTVTTATPKATPKASASTSAKPKPSAKPGATPSTFASPELTPTPTPGSGSVTSAQILPAAAEDRTIPISAAGLIIGFVLLMQLYVKRAQVAQDRVVAERVRGRQEAARPSPRPKRNDDW